MIVCSEHNVAWQDNIKSVKASCNSTELSAHFVVVVWSAIDTAFLFPDCLIGMHAVFMAKTASQLFADMDEIVEIDPYFWRY